MTKTPLALACAAILTMSGAINAGEISAGEISAGEISAGESGAQPGMVAPAIVGGDLAQTSQWGFYTQLVTRNGNRPFCGASYLGDGYVLTAAHCVAGDIPSQLAVKVGGFQYNGMDGQRANVANIYVHPNYNRGTLTNDIAVLKLERELPTATKVEIAAGALSQYAVAGDILSVAGLGRLQEGGNTPSHLMSVDVPLVTDSVCRQTGGNYSTIGEVSFCAGIPQGGKDACQGDSGGPIIVNQGGIITQLGVVSWGIGCARPGKYGVYSDIAALRGWLDSVISTPTDTVTVGYETTKQLASFKLGELVSHRFTVKNSGTVPFTVTTASLSASGVATKPVVVSDDCSQTSLTSGSACQVAIEFGASNVGQATVTLAFEIDKTNTVYQSVVQAQVSDSGQTGNCANEWQAGQVYNKGDVVFWQGSLWQAQWWNQGADPTQSGPWGVWQQVNGNGCDNPDPTPDPTPEPPVPVPTPDPEPTPPVGGNAYVAGGSYQPGDIVTHNGASYQCRAWPNGLWCSSSPVHYEPGRGVVWQDAWTRL